MRDPTVNHDAEDSERHHQSDSVLRIPGRLKGRLVISDQFEAASEEVAEELLSGAITSES